MHCISRNQLYKEKGRVDAQEDHDPRGFGETHGGDTGAPFTLVEEVARGAIDVPRGV